MGSLPCFEFETTKDNLSGFILTHRNEYWLKFPKVKKRTARAIKPDSIAGVSFVYRWNTWNHAYCQSERFLSSCMHRVSMKRSTMKQTKKGATTKSVDKFDTPYPLPLQTPFSENDERWNHSNRYSFFPINPSTSSISFGICDESTSQPSSVISTSSSIRIPIASSSMYRPGSIVITIPGCKTAL